MKRFIINILVLFYALLCCSAADRGVAFVETREAGELELLLGDELLTVEELTVRGPVNEADLKAMWQSTAFGCLQVLNLREADIAGKRLPNYIFYNGGILEGIPNKQGYVALRRVTLPDNLEEIGDRAFYLAVHLEEINIPVSVKVIGKDAFSSCWQLNPGTMVLSEGLEYLEERCFKNCRNLKNVVFPSTLKGISAYAFNGSGVEAAYLPDGLEYIGQEAFASCNSLKEVQLPNRGSFSLRQGVFADDMRLETISLPEGMVVLPDESFSGCLALREVDIPGSVREIGAKAFYGCRSLERIELPESLGKIGYRAFRGCTRVRILHLPKNVEQIIEGSLDLMSSLERIYCEACIAPKWEDSNNWSSSLFDKAEENRFKKTPADIPVYVPVGTIDQYRSMPGWDYFTNFIETDEFPTSALEEVRANRSMIEIEAANGSIVLRHNYTGIPVDFSVYTVEGRLVSIGSTDLFETFIKVPSGMFLVRVGSESRKIVVP